MVAAPASTQSASLCLIRCSAWTWFHLDASRGLRLSPPLLDLPTQLVLPRGTRMAGIARVFPLVERPQRPRVDGTQLWGKHLGLLIRALRSARPGDRAHVSLVIDGLAREVDDRARRVHLRVVDHRPDFRVSRAALADANHDPHRHRRAMFVDLPIEALPGGRAGTGPALNDLGAVAVRAPHPG